MKNLFCEFQHSLRAGGVEAASLRKVGPAAAAPPELLDCFLQKSGDIDG